MASTRFGRPPITFRRPPRSPIRRSGSCGCSTNAMSLDPAVARGRLLVRGALDDVPAGRDVLIAVSGGADSLALAAVTAFEARAAGWALRAVIVDHRLQAQSADVARHAGEQLADRKSVV